MITHSFNVVPTFVEVLHGLSRYEEQGLLASVNLLSVLLLVAATGLLALAMPLVLPYIIASRFSPAKLALTRQMFYMLLPSRVLSAMASIWGAFLNVGERLLWQRCRWRWFAIGTDRRLKADHQAIRPHDGGGDVDKQHYPGRSGELNVTLLHPNAVDWRGGHSFVEQHRFVDLILLFVASAE